MAELALVLHTFSHVKHRISVLLFAEAYYEFHTKLVFDCSDCLLIEFVIATTHLTQIQTRTESVDTALDHKLHIYSINPLAKTSSWVEMKN